MNLPTSPTPIRRLGFDVDGVLANFTYPVAALASQMFGVDVSGYATTWNWMREYGITDDKEKELWTWLKAHPEWWRNLPILDAAKGLINELQELQAVDNFDIYFITSRPGVGMKNATEFWLFEYGFAINPTVLIASSKGPIAEALKLDFYVDDRPENCADVADRGVLTYIVDRPWNGSFSHPGVRRVAEAREALVQLGILADAPAIDPDVVDISALGKRTAAVAEDAVATDVVAADGIE